MKSRYPAVAKALAPRPDATVLDGEIVALDGECRPSFNLLQNCGSSAAPLFYDVFDLIVIGGRDVMQEPLERRRTLKSATRSAIRPT